MTMVSICSSQNAQFTIPQSLTCCDLYVTKGLIPEFAKNIERKKG